MFKKLSLIFTLRDLRKAYKEEGAKGPVYLSRKFRGICIVGICSVLSLFLGLDITDLEVQQLTDNIEASISAIVGIYGFVMVLIGTFRRKQTNGKV